MKWTKIQTIPTLSELVGRKVTCVNCESEQFYFSHNPEKKSFVCTCEACGSAWEERKSGTTI